MAKLFNIVSSVQISCITSLVLLKIMSMIDSYENDNFVSTLTYHVNICKRKNYKNFCIQSATLFTLV